jgi:hypothetical protein
MWRTCQGYVGPWPADLSDDEVLERLLDLNLARAAKQS